MDVVNLQKLTEISSVLINQKRSTIGERGRERERERERERKRERENQGIPSCGQDGDYI